MYQCPRATEPKVPRLLAAEFSLIHVVSGHAADQEEW
jgi:hypothetical protein